jgi:hypothetical protein
VRPADEITLTVGWIGRHTPKGAGAGGREAAILDISQDLLLRELHDSGALDALAFKGGTALRKLYAGNQGRVLPRPRLQSRRAGGPRRGGPRIGKCH